MENNQKIVNFEWCKKCIHWNKSEQDDPCYECLDTPTKYASERPLYFEEDTTKKKGN